MSLFPPAPKPKSLLGYHRILSPTAGVRVSPLCLGAMNFGDAWKDYLGECNKETAFQMLDFFYENGGNFIDTANNYQAEESETWIGEWMKSKGNRDEIIIATKFTTGYRTGSHATEKIQSNFQGNHSKSLRVSLNASLRKLQTEYIDLLYVHWWDFTTSVEELMNSLHAMVQSGKVLYLGISDTPAWLVVKCNDYARFHGLTQFSVYQGHWSCAFRDFERDILPMVEAEGMGLAPWGALGRGQLKTSEEYNDPSREGRKMGPHNEKYARIADKLKAIADKKNTIITSIALAYVMHKAPYVFPIVGGRKIDHLKGNIEGLGVELTQEEIDEIEDAEPFDVGFPQSFLFTGGKPYRTRYTTKDIPLVTTVTAIETPPKQQPIPPKQGEKGLKLS
ncbi:Putative NADP-dependent oxidoreductase domain-containing protein [Septoria linicola]|uniref:NADP-dependent oxidoreductase domain-containing protein n=1 Tax=Septoria linicola TaxID=215465 RepID=A0A9Q9ARI4_9PEZI|nr:Putative NADP-dependent oxidoreductase domain-containing protein [Septoria linicola]